MGEIDAGDLALWHAINKTTKRIHSRTLPQPQPQRKSHYARAPAAVLVPVRPMVRNPHVALLSRKAARNARPEAHIDLHGCTQQQAQQLIRNFVQRSYTLNRLWIKIITGKSGILHQQAPLWLQALAPFINGYTPARPDDGGSGALYVRIRSQYRP